MANEFTNKIVLSDGTVLIDLTQDGVKPEHVQKDIWFHDKTGKRQQGTNTKTVDASGVTAEASEVLYNKSFGKGSEIQYGTMPDNSGKNVEITTKSGTPIPYGFSDGSGVAKLSDADLAKLIPANIKEGVTILGVAGDFGTDDFSSTAKEVTPTFNEQVLNPRDDGVEFYSSVTVKAIPVTRTDNNFGGVTVTIG
jgi:hypothetical protein